MPSPLPIEIRTRIVDACEDGEGTHKEVAARFEVSTSSGSRLLARARADRLEADVEGPTPHTRRLKAPHLAFLRAAIEDVPDSFFDETGSNAAMSRRTAWAPRGERVSLPGPIFASKVRFIGAIALDGVRGTMAIRGAIDGGALLAYLRAVLCPSLRPGHILVMDNLRVHKLAGVKEAVEAVERVVTSVPVHPVGRTAAYGASANGCGCAGLYSCG